MANTNEGIAGLVARLGTLAISAVLPKLVVLANALARENRLWTPETA